ncbi:MAG: hypothetical protein ABIQ12_01545 [Opitutaceae bacterium]
MKTIPRLTLAAALVFAFSACAKKDPHAGHDHSTHKHDHEHKAPHGGTAVVLGKEAFHLELVRDAAAGKLTAYVLDGEMENFIRLKAAAFEVAVTSGSAPRRLTFQPVANSATGETVGDTSQFEASADWLKTTTAFDATLVSLEIRGTTFAAVAFNFPKGNE